MKLKTKLARTWKLVLGSATAWNNQNALEWGAALAYYTAFSIAPLLIIALGIVGFYIGRAGVGSAYGAAGAVLIVLAWVYYSSQILFLGAEFTKLYAEERRFVVRPMKGAAAVTEEAKQRERGEIPPSEDVRKIA